MAKTLSRKEKRKHRSLKNKRTLAPHHNKYEIASNPSTLRIIKKAHRDMEKILKKTDEPLLNRLFRKENIEKLKNMPKDLIDITAYTTTLRKEFASLKKNKEYQPNQDYYDYVNNAWLKEQTDALKKHPTYYVEVDDFRIVQDKVYHEVINYTHDFIKASPASKKANSIKAVTHCIEKASKTKGLQHCQEILKQVTQFIEDEDMYGLLAYSNQDEIFSWQSPIVWSVRPDEKNVKNTLVISVPRN